MGPKKVDKGQLKAEEKRKQRIVEDKTFGLKNKNKSKAVQKYIKGVQAQARPQQKSEAAAMEAALKQKEDKKKAAQQDALLASLFKGTENVKSMATTTDPKAIREMQKIDLYTDQRASAMDGWNQEELEEVIKKRHGAQNANATDIICKYFVEAVEKKQYGWFWSCPNGGDSCKYRHCLPPGYVLRSSMPKEVDEEEDEEPIEEVIERERAALPSGGTPVTLETLNAWKERKKQERADEVEAKRQAEAKKTGGRGLGALTGKDLFIFDPSLFVDDEGAAAEDDYEEEEGEEAESSSSGDEDEEEGAGSQNEHECSDAGSDQTPGPSEPVTTRKELFVEEIPDVEDLAD